MAADVLDTVRANAMHEEFGKLIENYLGRRSVLMSYMKAEGKILSNFSGDSLSWRVPKSISQNAEFFATDSPKPIIAAENLEDKAIVNLSERGLKADYFLPFYTVARNKGKNQIFDLLRTRQYNARQAFTQKWERAMFAGQVIQGSEKIFGLRDFMPTSLVTSASAASGSYASINFNASGLDDAGNALFYWFGVARDATDENNFKGTFINTFMDIESEMNQRGEWGNPYAGDNISADWLRHAITEKETWNNMWQALDDRHRTFTSWKNTGGYSINAKFLEIMGVPVSHSFFCQTGFVWFIDPREFCIMHATEKLIDTRFTTTEVDNAKGYLGMLDANYQFALKNPYRGIALIFNARA